MTRLKKFDTKLVSAEESAAIAGALAVYLQNNKFVIKSIKPLDKDVMFLGKAKADPKTETSVPDAKYSFFTWRPKHK